ncbi:MAG: hypothetical protein J1G01_05605 [Clostridiales bacterium]|nr:hypothetical protein [Clostridiales bacterium]
MTNEEIENKMYELANKIDYESTNISHLKKAMYCKSIHKDGDGKNRKNYTNDNYATLGDALLKCILTEYFFQHDYDKSEITNKRKELENNNTLFELCNKNGIINYAYNDANFYPDAPKNKKVPHPIHDVYIEAIIAAIYLDREFNYCKNWVIKFFQKNDLLD